MELSCPLGIPRLVPQDQKSFFSVLSHIINPLLTKLVRQDGWILALVCFFCVFMDLDLASAHKHAKKELGKYPAILTSRLVNNPYLLLPRRVLASAGFWPRGPNPRRQPRSPRVKKGKYVNW